MGTTPQQLVTKNCIRIAAPNFSNRLKFVLDLIFVDWLKVGWLPSPLQSADLVYNCLNPQAIAIPCAGLLDECDIKECYRDVAFSKQHGKVVFFPNNAEQYTLKYDIFSAVFWLASRYEEYLPFEEDEHKRYPYTASFLYRQQLLSRPIADEWVEELRCLLENKLGRQLPKPTFYFQPTYDIDIAWSKKNYRPRYLLGKLAQSLFKGSKSFFHHLQVISGAKKDEFDSFSKLLTLPPTQAIYFILCAKHQSDFDKNNNRNSVAFKQLVSKLQRHGKIGIHPSYKSFTHYKLLIEEKQFLEKLSAQPITNTRQHYIRFCLPETLNSLIKAGLTDDYSMGYANINGFRAGTSRSFLFYDLPQEITRNLRIHPFVFMDTAAFYKEKKSAEEAFDDLEKLEQLIRFNGGPMITVFHNFSLGTDEQWKGWWPMYGQFVKTILK